jgi:hypothetical protein
MRAGGSSASGEMARLFNETVAIEQLFVSQVDFSERSALV